MSYSALLAFPEKGPCTTFREYSNSWRLGFMVWDAMAKKYGFDIFADVMRRDGRGERANQFWNLARNSDVPEHHRLVFAFTHDRVIAKRKDLDELASAVEIFGREMMPNDPGHLPAIAKDLRLLSEKEDVFAAGLLVTSVTDTWQVRETCPTCEQELDDARNYDLGKDKRHHELISLIQPEEASS